MKLSAFSNVKILVLVPVFAFFCLLTPNFIFANSTENTLQDTLKKDSLVEHTSALPEENAHHEQSEEKFNAGEMIMEHIGDAYDWHIMDIGEHPVSIPLPVILYNNGHLDCFMSSGLHHGHDTVQTANGYGYFLNKKNKLEATNGSNFYDFSISKNVAALLVSMLVILIIFISIANRYKNNAKRAPKGLQSLFEPFIIFIRDEVAKPSIGKNANRYMPYLLTVFFFVWINNMLGLIPIAPFGANLTGNIACTLTLALFTFMITLASSKKAFWIHIINTPGVPWWLKFPLPLMPVVELLGVFIKPFVLTLRLFANITAGHIIPLGFISLIFIFGKQSVAVGYGVSVVSVALNLFMSVLELLVAFLQAYIFTLLSAMYFGQALEEHHHEEHH